MPAPTYTSIPTPVADVNSLLETVKALKRCVEALTAKTNGAYPPPRVFMQQQQPTPKDDDIKVGDLWIRPATAAITGIAPTKDGAISGNQAVHLAYWTPSKVWAKLL